MRIALIFACLAVGASAQVAAAEDGELVCVIGKPATFDTDTIACYSEDGCEHATAMGGGPVRNYDVESAPFALARGKIGAIITASPALVKAAEKVGAACASIAKP